VLSWDDILHEGPVRAIASGRFRAERADHIAERGWAPRAAVLKGLEARDAILEAALGGGEEIVLWFEDDLYDALQLMQVLARLDRRAGTTSWSLVPLGGMPFRGIAERPLDELSEAFGQRATPPGAGAYAVRVWEAFCAGDYPALGALSRAPAPLDALPAALRRLLEELPDAVDGLTRTERALLAATADGPVTGVAAFLAAAAQEERPYLGDSVAFDRLADLVVAGLAESEGEGPPAARTFAASEAGREVLAGARRAPERPRWLGGARVGPAAGPHWSRAAERVVTA
jgi:hypothetical protein